MYPFLQSPETTGFGLSLINQRTRVFNRTGTVLTPGAIIMADNLAAPDASIDVAARWGALTHWSANCVLPTALGIGNVSGTATSLGRASIFYLVEDLLEGGGADDTAVRVIARGFDVFANLDNSAVLAQSPLMPAAAAATLTLAAGVTVKLGTAKVANASTAGRFLLQEFDGVSAWLHGRQQFAS
jgi:hypothetical protein